MPWSVHPSAGATTGSITLICFGMEHFDADAVVNKLAERGVKASIRLRGDTTELYFTDPDGIRVQLQDTKYKGGTGPLVINSWRICGRIRVRICGGGLHDW